MKKIVALVVIALIGGYGIIQTNGLKIMSLLSDDDGIARTKPVQKVTLPTVSGPTSYKNGTYTGSAADAFYGNMQVQVVISNNRISDVKFLSYPNDRPRSIAINTLAMPNLKQEALSAQSATVDVISGATDSSMAFMQSLASALNQAK